MRSDPQQSWSWQSSRRAVPNQFRIRQQAKTVKRILWESREHWRLPHDLSLGRPVLCFICAVTIAESDICMDRILMAYNRWSPLPHSTVHTASDIKGHSAVRFAAAAWHLWDSLMWQPRQLLLPVACRLLPLPTLLARMPAQFWLPCSAWTALYLSLSLSIIPGLRC